MCRNSSVRNQGGVKGKRRGLLIKNTGTIKIEKAN